MKKQINNLIIKNKNISTQHHHETKTLVKNKNINHVKNKVLALCNEGDIFLDSGCTDTSYRETEAMSVKYDNTQIAPSISLKTAGGQKIKSIKSGKIKFDSIDHEVNVFKNEDLSLSLHSAADFTNNGDNKVILHKRGFEIVNPDDKVILKGNKLPDDRLWKLPPTREAIGNLFIKNEFDAEFVAYSSACFGNPPDSTLIKAVKRGYLSNYKRLTPKMIHANQPHSIASAEGHLDRE